VNELGASAAGARREVLPLNKRNSAEENEMRQLIRACFGLDLLESASYRIDCAASTSATASNNEDVEVSEA
jgi:hypothetical protein